jgi:hypothetical protein
MNFTNAVVRRSKATASSTTAPRARSRFFYTEAWNSVQAVGISPFAAAGSICIVTASLAAAVRMVISPELKELAADTKLLRETTELKLGSLEKIIVSSQKNIEKSIESNQKSLEKSIESNQKITELKLGGLETSIEANQNFIKLQFATLTTLAMNGEVNKATLLQLGNLVAEAEATNLKLDNAEKAKEVNATARADAKRDTDEAISLFKKKQLYSNR